MTQQEKLNGVHLVLSKTYLVAWQFLSTASIEISQCWALALVLAEDALLQKASHGVCTDCKSVYHVYNLSCIELNFEKRPGPEVIKLLSCSTQLSLKF